MILNKFDSPNTFKTPLLHLMLSTIHELCPETEVLYHRDFSENIGFPESELPIQTTNESIARRLQGETLNSKGWDFEWIEQYPFVQGSLEAFKRNKLKSGDYNDF